MSRLQLAYEVSVRRAMLCRANISRPATNLSELVHLFFGGALPGGSVLQLIRARRCARRAGRVVGGQHVPAPGRLWVLAREPFVIDAGPRQHIVAEIVH